MEQVNDLKWVLNALGAAAPLNTGPPAPAACGGLRPNRPESRLS